MSGGGQLNEAILSLLKSARWKVVIYTPDFNLPAEVRRAGSRWPWALGHRVMIVVGDRTAKDFFNPPGEPFRIIGLLPYLYEANLRRFTKAHRLAMTNGQLKVFLWLHGDNTFHLKGLFIDDDITLLTGNNLNPRAWNLDLENGLLKRDPKGLLKAQCQTARALILKHATRLVGYQGLETPRAYPPKVQQALKNRHTVRIDRLLKRLL